MNKYIIYIIRKIFPKELPKPMGRWRIENSNIQINNKIDLSNEDHCGPCGQYALSKIEFKNKQKMDNKDKNKNTSFSLFNV
jgi:hypothetical protein